MQRTQYFFSAYRAALAQACDCSSDDCEFYSDLERFLVPLILIKSDAMKTIPLATALLFGQYQTNFGMVFAALSMASLPIVVFYLLFSKFFTKGLLQGAIKG